MHPDFASAPTLCECECACHRARACLRDPQDCPLLIGLQMEQLYYALYDFLTDLLLAAGNERECESECVCARTRVSVRNEYQRSGCVFGTEGFPFGWKFTEERP